MYQKMEDLDLNGKVVLIRQDLNVPINDGRVSNDARIRASIPTIEMALKAGARVRLMSHLGRPNEGQYDDEYSLEPVAKRLSQLLEREVVLQNNWLDSDSKAAANNLILFENVRFNKGEKANAAELSKKMAVLCDVYVMDAFGTAHRAHASTCGIAEYAKEVCAGPLLSKELDALRKALDEPAKPIVAIVGGSKVSTKVTVLDALSSKVDQLIVGGGIANTFIAAAGHSVGKSLYEEDFLDQANELVKSARSNDGDIPVPVDVVCAKTFAENAQATIKGVSEVEDDDLILDVGPETAKRLASILKGAGTIVWNGPVGVFEFDQFSKGTEILANAVANSPAFSIAGGGDTVAAIEKFGVAENVSYISTGGGAFLEFLEGKALPGVVALTKSE